MSTYCQNIVKAHDYERYLLSLFAPLQMRPALWALFALNYEIAKTREVVSDTTIGLIRLQWWRDAIAEIYEGAVVRRHEVVQPLAAAIQKYDLPREDFDALIYAREFDLEGVAPATIKGLIHYCDYTTTPLMKLMLKILGEQADEDQIKAIAVHYAAIGTLRAVPYLRQQRRLLLPVDILAHHNLSEQKFFDFNPQKELPNIIQEVINLIQPYRKQGAGAKSKFLKTSHAVSCLYEDQIKRVNYDLFNPAMGQPPKFFAFRIWLKSF